MQQTATHRTFGMRRARGFTKKSNTFHTRHCNILQHTVKQCNKLQHAAPSGCAGIAASPKRAIHSALDTWSASVSSVCRMRSSSACSACCSDCCSVLQDVAVCCSGWHPCQVCAGYGRFLLAVRVAAIVAKLQRLLHTATHCNTLQHTATHYSSHT